MTVSDLIIRLYQRNSVEFDTTEKRHFHLIIIDQDLNVLLLLQRHAKRRRNTVPKSLHLQRDQLMEHLLNSPEPDSQGHPVSKAILAGARHKNEFWCRLCACTVQKTHFCDAHILMPSTDHVPHQDIGKGFFFVTASGKVLFSALQALGQLLSNAKDIVCIQCLRTDGNYHQNQAHIMKHLPILQAYEKRKPWQKKKACLKYNLPKQNSLEGYVNQLMVHKVSTRIPKKLKKHFTKPNNIFKMLQITSESRPAILQLQAAARTAQLPQLLGLLQQSMAVTEPSVLPSISNYVVKIGQEYRIDPGRYPIPLYSNEEGCQTDVGITMMDSVITLGFHSLFPIRCENIGSIKIETPVTQIPIGKVAIEGNEVMKNASAARIKQIFRDLPNRIFVLEVQGYKDGLPAFDLISRQVTIIAETYRSSKQMWPLFIVIAAPTKEQLNQHSERIMMEHHQLAENYASIICYQKNVILLPMQGILLPTPQDLICDRRGNPCTALTAHGEHILTNEGADLLTGLLIRYISGRSTHLQHNNIKHLHNFSFF